MQVYVVACFVQQDTSGMKPVYIKRIYNRDSYLNLSAQVACTVGLP